MSDMTHSESNSLLPENVTISQAKINENDKQQELVLKERHDFEVSISKFEAKRKKYVELNELRKAVLAKEKEIALIEREELEKPEPVQEESIIGYTLNPETMERIPLRSINQKKNQERLVSGRWIEQE